MKLFCCKKTTRFVLALFNVCFFVGFQDPSGHSNLGAMLHLVGKLREAEASYLRALELAPEDANTRVNLKRLRNVMRAKGVTTLED